MRKIPTLFKRDPDDMRHLLSEVHPDCAWVLAGEGTATRKYDGTCVYFDGEEWFARREVKPGKASPAGFIGIDHDPNTGKMVGWEPVAQSPFAKFHAEAVGSVTGWGEGTYELLGPKIQGNPERLAIHTLIAHAAAQVLDVHPGSLDEARAAVLEFWDEGGYEGIVWHHPDGRMAKLKARDFA